jgi:predicted nucleic acid-binding protein
MSAEFSDSNVLIYAASSDPWKAARARRLLDDRLTISVQVLNEIANVLTKKWKWSWSDKLEFLTLVRDHTRVVAVDEETHDLGIEIAMRHRLAIYDSMIVAAALLANCDTLYSEDMHHGLVIENRLAIVNPFATA